MYGQTLSEFVSNALRALVLRVAAFYYPLDQGGLGVRHLKSAVQSWRLLLLERLHIAFVKSDWPIPSGDDRTQQLAAVSRRLVAGGGT